MSDSNKKEDLASSDEEHFEDAVSKTNEEVVDEIISKQFGDISLEKGKNIESEKELKPDKEDDDEKFDDCNEDIIDDEGQRELEKDMTDEERQQNKRKAEELKKQGNESFKNEDYAQSAETYTAALRLCPVDCSNDRAILYANRAAAKIKLDLKNSAIDDCTKALEFNPTYVKALIRRAKLYEDKDKLDESLEDYKKILEIDPDYSEARQALVRLPPLINERNEKLKEEMMGKLKDLGNMILKPFGLSTSNFQMQQDPNTGSYSINFNQNSK